jgi:hypothetical protein
MKKLVYVMMVIIPAICLANDNFLIQLDIKNLPPSDTAGFVQSKTAIQTNYDQMYISLPCEQRLRIQSAAASIDNLRLKSAQDAQSILSTQRERAEQSMQTTVSQMAVADAVKTQIENARRETILRINEKVLELKTRRAAHR